MEGQFTQSTSGPSGLPGRTEDELNRVKEEEEMRASLMATVLDSAARERLSRIALVSPDRSKQIEGALLRMAQTGQLRGKVTEGQLIEFLEQMEEAQGRSTGKKSTIVYQRRRDLDDDDFDI